MRRLDPRFLLVLGCFALSGFTGLLYETVWTRQFSFVFGTSSLAVSTVLAAYMGGLAAGAAIAGRYLDRIERPVLVYGMLELGVALCALAVPFAIEATRSLHVELLRGVTDPGSPLALALYLVASFAILFLPTTFMGATLPLLAREVVRSDAEIGRRVGLLYSINTFGAVGGTVVAAFWLIPDLGLRVTVYIGAALNALIFGLAWLLASTGRNSPGSPEHSADRVGGQEAEEVAPSVSPRALLGLTPARAIGLIAFGAGVASFTYEVFWVRLIEHVLGGSVYAFAAMLASFLLGIAGGGVAASRWASRMERAVVGLTFSQLGAALFSLLAYHAILRVPEWLRTLEPADGLAGLLETAGLTTLILLPSTLCIGAMLPFAVRVLSAGAASAGRASARVYAANTLGAIVGSVATGFVTLPLLGFAGTLIFAAFVNLVLALLAWALTPGVSTDRRRAPAIIALAIGLASILHPPPTPWTLLRSAPGRLERALYSNDENVLYYAVGRSATVLATREPDGIRIRTNGMPEAIISGPGARPGRALTSRWLGVLPALAEQPPRRLLMIGLGGSVALESIPDSIETIDVVELEPEVVAANRAVDGERQVDVQADPRIEIRLGDARSVLELEREPYDAIVSQPSHPWTAGSSHLYTRDFFERVRGRLTPEGIFVQWIDGSFVDAELLRSFAATITSVFPNVRLYRPRIDGLLFVASADRLALEQRTVDRMTSLGEGLARVAIEGPASLAAALALDEEAMRTIGEGARPISDDHNAMAARAPLLGPSARESREALFLEHDPLGGGWPGLPSHRVVRALLDSFQADRAARFVASLPEGPDREVAAGVLDVGMGNRVGARQRFDALARAQEVAGEDLARVARWYSLRLDLVAARLRAQAGELVGPGRDQFSPESPEAIVVAAWAAQANPGETPEPLDGALAGIPRIALAYEDARAIRIAWRLGQADRSRAREALALMDERVRPWTLPRLVDRAYAAALAGERPAVRDTLIELAGQPGPLSPTHLRRARIALSALGKADLEPATREILLKRLGVGPR